MFAAIPIDLLTDEDRVRFGVEARAASICAEGGEVHVHRGQYGHLVDDLATSEPATARVRRGRHACSERRSAAGAVQTDILRQAKFACDLSESDLAATLDLRKQQVQRILSGELPFEVLHLLMFLPRRFPDVAFPIEVLVRIGAHLGDGGLLPLIERLIAELSAPARAWLLAKLRKQ